LECNRELFLTKHVETSGNLFAKKEVLSTMDRSSKRRFSPSDRDSRKRSPDSSASGEYYSPDSSPNSSPDSSPHNATTSRKRPRPWELGGSSRPADQLASTSSSGLEHGGLGQVTYELQKPIDLMNQNLEVLPPETVDKMHKHLRSLDDETRLVSIEEFGTEKLEGYLNTLKSSDEKKEFLGWLKDSNIVLRLYQSINGKHEFLRYLDDERRLEAIGALNNDELSAHFNTSKSSDDRNEFLGWLKDSNIVLRLYQSINGKHELLRSFDGNMRQQVIYSLNSAILAEHFNALRSPDEKNEFCGWLKHEYNSLRLYQSINGKHELLRSFDGNMRQQVIKKLNNDKLAEHFNALRSPDEKNEFCGWLDRDQIKDLYLHFEKKDVDKQKEFVRGLNAEQVIGLCLKFVYETNRRTQILRYSSFAQIEQIYQPSDSSHKHSKMNKELCRATDQEKFENLKKKFDPEGQKFEFHELARFFDREYDKVKEQININYTEKPEFFVSSQSCRAGR
jgi:hypothetical protein